MERKYFFNYLKTKFGNGLTPNGDKAQERLTEESFTEFSWVVPFNLLANPNASFRNLALNTGFVSPNLNFINGI